MICPACGIELRYLEICAYHLGDYDAEPWSTNNRLVCDLIHRGLAPPRIDPVDRPLASLEATR